MSAKTSGQAIRQFVDTVKACSIVQKQHELKEIISGPLAVARDKIQLLETDEAATVLARIDPNYHNDLKENVKGIFHEEVERGNLTLQEIDSNLLELHTLLDTIGQRISNEEQASKTTPMIINCFEDARYVLMFLKLRTNELRLKLSLGINENVTNINGIESQIDEGNFVFSLSKLETCCSTDRIQ
ncbi:unnamed protein product [Orchesella dallaii]|uniref:Uncharacterized protein n=1 Tax=Orchesella dallaii TaxID=48710 RepID=A0ABP1QET1_9HEXA